MFQRVHRAVAVVAGTVAISITLAACGSSDPDTDPDTGSGDSTTGVEQAKTEVANFSNDTEFEIEPLASKPPAGKVVAQVNCTLPTCLPGGMEEPIEALGWELNVFEFDLTKGPQDLVRAFDQALDSKPDYVVATVVFPEEIVADQLARAEAEGIPVVSVGGQVDDQVAMLVQGPGVFQEAGRIAANYVLADAGHAVSAVLPHDPAYPFAVNLAEGVKNELEQLSPDSSGEMLELSLAQPAATNVSATVNYLKSNPETEYIVFPGTSFYTGLKQALEAAGLTDKVKIVLTFPFPTDIPAIEAGEFVACIAGEAHHLWRQVDALTRLSVGQEIENKSPVSDFRILTPDNVTPEAIDPPDYKNVYKAAWGV